MDNNVPSCLSTPHKAHYIPSSSSSSDHQYHHQFYQHQQYLMNASLHYSQTPHLALNLNDDVEPPQNDTNTNNNNNNETDDDDDNDGDADGEEPMFEKPLTPSDVGKLNRLVIPKQHAEKYFPLGGGGGDSAGGEKGLLLSFEDESGKAWRFRYSYWNSSQSYVLTKGWSRYVKEKRLDAGDVVLFKRHRRHADRLFIGWRRRAAESAAPAQGSGRGVYGAPRAYPAPPGGGGGGVVAVPYQPDCVHAGLLSAAQSQTTTLGNININNINNSNNNNNSNSSSTSNNNSSKILRLFGVNLECHNNEQSSEPSTPDGSSLSSHGQAHHHHFYPSANYYSDHQYHDHMDFTFSRDVNPMRNRRG